MEKGIYCCTFVLANKKRRSQCAGGRLGRVAEREQLTLKLKHSLSCRAESRHLLRSLHALRSVEMTTLKKKGTKNYGK